MRCRDPQSLALLGLAALAAASCTTAQPRSQTARTAECAIATIEGLADSPGLFGGRRICVSGFFGRMVPYGETSAELFATREQAQTIQAPHYIELGVQLDLRTQEYLSRYSAQPVQVEGTFEFDAQCWPRRGRSEPDLTCFPPRPMRIKDPILRFPDGTRFASQVRSEGNRASNLNGPQIGIQRPADR